MILKEIQQIFHNELDSIYNANEVDAMFYTLTKHYANLDRIVLALEPNKVVSKKVDEKLFKALAKLKLEKPLQYIIGSTAFFEMTFKVNKHTLIPRPETEELVQWILDDYTKNTSEQINILDIGTGSGCIAITLAKNLPNATIYALDVSKKALKVAKKNAKKNEVDVTFIHQDILGALKDKVKNLQFDVIVSNPPYVRELEKAEMSKNVLNFEPDDALYVDDDNPLVFYKAITQFAQKQLKPNGNLYFEINQYLGQEMVALLKNHNFKDIELKQDIFGVDRMTKAVWS